ncbi:di-sulfide bridge nucleocytoplasmic transport domain-containing protein [Elsinoe australis]|uniref:Di-sulfide bridge nucleocytoplasmic transport domain-containing protein n=1 Tax=Elsinoe australis TaxID=40998 RepID=A0A4U7AM94_9PEZI|nr:di-sulfide bridge nucleocytoplasmic transport domain-containing protein [Elsinoe australis]
MDFRSNAGPMDFEYQNGTGPIDGRSPFAQVSGNHQRSFGGLADSPTKKRGMILRSSCKSNAEELSNIPDHEAGIASAFGSPSKSAAPSLRPTSSQPDSYMQSTNPPSQSKNFGFRGSIFSTPRKLEPEIASSGGETPKSPEQASLLDSDATPDNSMNFRGVPARFDAATTPQLSPSKAKNKQLTKVAEKENNKERRRDSWLAKAASLTNFMSASPNSTQHASGKGEVTRGQAHNDNKIVKKAQKKRQGDAVRRFVKLRTGSVSEAESEDSRPPSPSKSKRLFGRSKKGTPPPETPPQKGGIASFFKFLTDHPTLPQILSWYAQLTLNFFLVSGLIYLLWSFYSTIKTDIDKKSTEAVSELLAEMAICARQYTDNRCAPETRVPAMETVCNNWEKCMNRDTRAVGRARISVHTWAEVFNAFVEPISWKAMIFSVFIVFGCIALSNLPFSMIRHKADQAAANHHHYYGNVPPTPGRQFSNPDMQNGYWTPHPQHAGLEPAPSQA